MQEHLEAIANCQLPLSATVHLSSSSCSLELMRIIDVVAARWLVAEVELGGEFLAVCLQHLQGKKHLMSSPAKGPVGKKHLVSISKNGFSSALAAAMAADRATVTCCSCCSPSSI